MKKKAFVSAVALSLTLTACAPDGQQQPSAAGNAAAPSGGQGGAITVVARAGTYYNNIAKAAPEFEKATGIKVNVQEVGRDGYLQKVSTQLLGQTDSVDIVLMLNNYIGQFGAGGQFEQLDSYIEKSNASMDRFLPVSQEAVKYQNKVYALPLDVSTMFLVYRKDLIPTPPKTWDEYREMARQFTKSINPGSPTEFGTTFQGKRGETQPKEWYQYFWAMGGELLDGQMKPQLNSEAGVKALAYVVDNFRKEKMVPPDITTYEFPEVLSAFQNEKTAMAIEWNTAYPTMMDQTKSPKIFDKFAIAEVPGGMPYTHNWTLAMNANSKNKEAAFKFMNWITDPKEGAKYYTLAGGIPPLPSILEDPEIVKVRPEFPEIQKTLLKAKSEPNLPEWPRIHEFITEAITKALAGEKSPQDALNDANKGIAELLESRGYYKK